jgi:hypothetical protein
MKSFCVSVFAVVFFLGGAASANDSSFTPLQDYKMAASKIGDRESLIELGAGLSAIVGARALDEEAQDYFNGHHRIGAFEELGNEVLGTGVPGVAIGAAFWITGVNAHDSKAVRAGQAQLEAMLATSLTTSVLKVSAHRERPDASDDKSFPSGHTSTMFASASVLSRFYGWRAGVPAYSLAVLTGLGRVSSNRHWFSDTAAGALIGELIGNAVARAHLEESRSSLTFIPLEPSEGDPGRRGVVARFEFQ